MLTAKIIDDFLEDEVKSLLHVFFLNSISCAQNGVTDKMEKLKTGLAALKQVKSDLLSLLEQSE
jgi:hypothetical protein